MASLLDFDRIHKAEDESARKTHSMPYDEYFGEMQISDDEKEDRVSLAERLEDIFLYFLMLLLTMRQYGNLDWDDVQRQMETSIMAAAAGYAPDDDFASRYAASIAKSIIDVTKRHMDDPYYFSSDRAMYLAENEANTILNNSDYSQALLSGKQWKKWIDMRDNRERQSHLKVGGTVLPIAEPFKVGDSLMMFPKDLSFDPSPEQVVNCRCSAKYF